MELWPRQVKRRSNEGKRDSDLSFSHSFSPDRHRLASFQLVQTNHQRAKMARSLSPLVVPKTAAMVLPFSSPYLLAVSAHLLSDPRMMTVSSYLGLIHPVPAQSAFTYGIESHACESFGCITLYHGAALEALIVTNS